MAIPKISTMVTWRQRLYERVQQFLRLHREEVAEALDLFLKEVGDEGLDGSDVAPPDVEALLERFHKRLQRSMDDLIEAERLLLDELSNDLEPRQRRDRAAEDLRDDLFHLRDLFRGAYSRPTAEGVGFEKRIADDSRALARQGERVAGRLRDPELQLGEPRFEGIEIPVERAAKAVERPLARLRDALDDVTRERAREQGRRIAKDLAMERFDAVFRPIVKILKSAFRLAGYHELAKRIPSSLRRQPRAAGRESKPGASE